MKEINLKNEPGVSVIVPVYNNQNTLAATLNSLVKQTYKNLEIIIVNDGSTDSSMKIVEKFSFDRRIRVLTQEHLGLGSALNAGHDVSVGEHITYCRPGCIFYPMMVHVMDAALSAAKSQDKPVDFVYSDFEFITKENKIVDKVIHQPTNNKQSLLEKYDAGVSLMYTRDLWKKTGPYWSQLCENYQWAVRAAEYTTFGLVGAVLVGLLIQEQTEAEVGAEKSAAEECKELARALFLLDPASELPPSNIVVPASG